MKKSIPIRENVTNDELLQIAKTRFSKYKSGTTKKIEGTYVYIDRNSFFRVLLRIANDKNNKPALYAIDGCTTIGSLFAFPIYGRSVMKSFVDEVLSVYAAELSSKSR